MKDKIVLVTGSTSGIGMQVAIELAGRGATVLIHARTVIKGSETLEMLRQQLPAASFNVFISDFEKQHEIEQMAREIRLAYTRLDILVNNAAVYMERRGLTTDTIETTFAVNHLAPFLLTQLLLPLLQSSPFARIINVSSHTHYTAQFNVNNLQGELSYIGTKIYCCSKLCNLLFTYMLAEKLKDKNIMVNAVHPGFITTRLYKTLFGDFDSESLKDGADTIAFLASSDAVKNITGMYFMGRMPSKSSAISYKKRYQQQLWKMSEKLTMIRDYLSDTGTEVPGTRQRELNLQK
ncbi:MAG: SDR family NAD(P)-dependent oxidoreductase [Chitinophagaceae bacterium]